MIRQLEKPLPFAMKSTSYSISFELSFEQGSIDMLASYYSFSHWVDSINDRMRNAPIVRTESWQSTPNVGKPETATYELLHESAQISLVLVEKKTTELTLKDMRRVIRPNLPWADDHFAERIGGQPLNPGVEWANWPHAKSADRFRDSYGQFSHTYMERHWPKHANIDDPQPRFSKGSHAGIRFAYGDTMDVVELMRREPHTRQAYLPIFFPEDTGCVHGTRIPCTIGYQFIQRNGKLDMAYTLRSCDYANHFRDDVYLAMRLMLWMRDNVNPEWVLGKFLMHITSLHCFVNDHRKLMGG